MIMTLKKMKTAIVLAAAILALACFAACAGGNKADPSSTADPAETPAQPTAPVDTGKVELYQLAPERDSLMMSYIIVTPHRKIIVIDGGLDGAGFAAPPYLPSAIRGILGIGQNDYFEVEAWFLSHGHKDHLNELAKMLTAYKAEDNYKINNFYFDFPDFGKEWKTSSGEGDYDLEEVEKLKQGIENYYTVNPFGGIYGANIPEEQWTRPADAENYYYDLVNGAVINGTSVRDGLTISIDGVDFQVLLTWKKASTNVNSTSVILRMVYEGKSVLFLGDAYTDSGQRLLKQYEADQIKSDYIQMGHHGQNGPAKAFYDAIDAANSKRLWPTPVWVWEVYKSKNNINTDTTRKWLGLPADFNEFAAQGLLEAGNDFISGLYKAYPDDPTRVDCWNKDVLDAQRVAVFERFERSS